MDADLTIVRDTVYDQYMALPSYLEFAKNTIYDRRTKNIVCKPIASYTTFAVPAFPHQNRTVLVKKVISL